MTPLRPPPPRLPRRRMAAPLPPVLASEAVAQERRWVQIGLGALAGALFMLFLVSFFSDLTEIAAGGGPREEFEDTRF